MVTPWFFGGVWARVQWVLILLVGLLLAMDLVERFGDHDRPNVIPTLWIPLLAGVLLGLFQLVPLSPGMANWLAPATARWRSELTSAAVGGVEQTDVAASPGSRIEPSATRIPRSLYALATREYLSLLILAAGVLALASLHLVDRQSILWFCAGMAICGTLLSFFGLVQRLSWNGKFYWVFEPLYGGYESFGPFVNRNNAGGFLNLCLAAGLGLLIWVHWDPAETRAESVRSGRHRRRRYRSRTRSDSAHKRFSRRHVPHSRPDHRDPHAAPGRVGDRDVGPTKGPKDGLVEEPRGEIADHATGSDSPSSGRPDSAAESQESVGIPSRSAHESEVRSPTPRSRVRDQGASSVIHPVSYRRSSRGWSTWRNAFSDYVADLSARRMWSLILVGLTAGGVLCTASRGSILAMFAAAMVTAAALALNSGNRRYALALVVMLLVGSGFMAWAGQTDFVRARLALLFDQSQLESGRVPNWRESLETVPDFWVAGTGLGTYRFVYERFQQRFLRDIAHFHAENQYIQSLVEGGVLALGLLLLAILLTALAIVHLFRAGGSINTVLAVVGTFALVSQIVGGSFDFGLYIPANMMLMATICGAVVGRAALLSVWPPDVLIALDHPEPKPASGYVVGRRSSGGHRRISDERQLVQGTTRSRRVSPSPRSDNPPSRWLLFGLPAPTSLVTFLVGFLLLGTLFSSLEMNRAGRIEAALRAAPLDEVREMDDPAMVASAMIPLQTALPQRWDDALAQQRLAELRMQLYQAETYARLQELQATPESTESESASAESSNERDEELWNRASVWHWHQTVRQRQREGDSTGAAQLIADPVVQDTLVPAARALQTARQSAPTIPQVHLLLAELSPLLPTDGDETVHLRRAALLAPGDATLLYWVGLIDLQSGRRESACQHWRQSLTLAPLHLADVMSSARGRLTNGQLLRDVIPARSDLLLRVAQQYFTDEDSVGVRTAFLERAAETLGQSELPADEGAYVAATIYRMLGRPQEALDQYSDAISRNQQKLAWRYEYAQLLFEQQRYDAAYEQATFLIRAQPDRVAYQRLLKEVNARRLRQGAPQRD